MTRMLIALLPFFAIASVLASIAIISAAYGWHEATMWQRLATETKR